MLEKKGKIVDYRILWWTNSFDRIAVGIVATSYSDCVDFGAVFQFFENKCPSENGKKIIQTLDSSLNYLIKKKSSNNEEFSLIDGFPEGHGGSFEWSEIKTSRTSFSFFEYFLYLCELISPSIENASSIIESQENNSKTLDGYHLSKIEKGIFGESSKIKEELEELIDAENQKSKIMMAVELSDLYGAIEEFADKKLSLEMNDLKSMSDITKRAFVSGARK